MLYLISTLLIVWFPEAISNAPIEDHMRMHTAVVANATLIALSILMLIARVCSWLGNTLVDVMHGMITPQSNKWHAIKTDHSDIGDD